MKNKIYPAVLIILVITILLSAECCNDNKKNAGSNFIALTDTVTYFTNALGTQSASIKTLQLKESQLKNTILAKDKELATLTKQFSKVKTIVKHTQVVKLDTINILFKDTVPCTFSREGTLKNKWYSLNYKGNNKGFAIDSLIITNQVTTIMGYKRKWLLGEETLVTDVINSNPYITTKTLQSIQIIVPVPWYKKWYVWAAGGIVGGFLISK